MANIEIEIDEIKIGLLFIKNADVFKSDNLFREFLIQNISETIRSERDEILKKSVRDMLRYGKYRPSGRGKPASEYLWEAAQKGSFPFINNFVDALNFVSLKSGLPVSLIDTKKAGTENFRIRRGREGEFYDFNSSGQILHLEDLLLAATLEEDMPVATPVKDSQKTKIDEKSKEFVALIYSPLSAGKFLREVVETLSDYYKKWGEVCEQKIF